MNLRLAMLKRLEESGMDGDMPEDYEKLLASLDDAVNQQREHNRTTFNLDSR